MPSCRPHVPVSLCLRSGAGGGGGGVTVGDMLRTGPGVWQVLCKSQLLFSKESGIFLPAPTNSQELLLWPSVLILWGR